MADIESQQAHHLPGNLFPCSTARPQYNHHVLHIVGTSLIRLDNLPFSSAHVSAHDLLWIPPVTTTGQLEGRREDVLPASAVGEDAVRSALQDPRSINVSNYGMGDYPELHGFSEYLTAPSTHSNVGPSQGVPGREKFIFQENQGNDHVGHAPEGIVPGPTRATLAGPSGRRSPVLSQPSAENLRRLASRCVHHPDSQVDSVRMVPGTAGRYKVMIELEITDFL